MRKINGMIAAMPTPFNEDESIDFDGVKKLLKHLDDGGITSVLIGGSTGEYSLMTIDERKELIKTACEQNLKSAKIIAGASCSRPSQTKDLIEFSASVGADFALVIPPYYLKTSRQGIIDYYKEVASSNVLDIMIYNYPAATGVELAPDLIWELSKIKGIVGIKDTDEMEHTSKLISMFKNEDFSVINGCEHLIMGTLAAGGDGTMGIIHNLVPEMMMDIYKNMQNNDWKKATEINKKLVPLYTLMEKEPYPGPVKAALEIMGLPGGKPRKPVVAPSEQMITTLKKELTRIGAI